MREKTGIEMAGVSEKSCLIIFHIFPSAFRLAINFNWLCEINKAQ